MGALHKISEAVVEIKRVGVDPDYQGRGIGRGLLLALEGRAAAMGFERIVLDTTEMQVAAQAMYANHGYVEIERKPVIYSPAVTMETIFYAKDL